MRNNSIIKDMRERNVQRMIKRITDHHESLWESMNDPSKEHSQYTKENLLCWTFTDLSKDVITEMMTPSQYKKVMKFLVDTHNSYMEKLRDSEE